MVRLESGPGRAMRAAFAIVGGLCAVWLATAAGEARAAVTCRAEVSRSTVARGEDVVLIVTAQGDTGWSPSFQLPDLPGIRVYGGGTNQSMTVINGQTQVMVSRTYYLRPENEGSFTIGPVRVSTAAGPCETAPIEIKVVAGAAPPADTGNRVQRAAQGRSASPEGADDVFVTMSVDKSDIWVGQQIVLSFQFWRRVQPWSNPSYTAPRTEGFWREDLGPERSFRDVHKGQVYSVTEVRYALFPTRAGKLQIEPAELSFPEDLFDRFFNSRQQSSGPRVLRTRPVTVNVRELPAPKPSGFSGIVATRCEISGAVDRTSVERGGAIGLKLSLETDGFLKGFAGLKVVEPEGTRLHDATENFATVPQDNRLIGRLSAEKVLVTTREGPVRVPAVEVVWFDAAKGAYRTARTASHDVTVTPSDRPLAGGEDSGFLRNEIARVGDDLAFIHAGPVGVAGALPPVGGGAWWTLVVAPGLLLGGWRWWLGRQAADLRNPAARRRRGALAAARALLRSASAAGETSDGLAMVSRAVIGYVADSLDLPVTAVGTPEVQALAGRRGLPEIGSALAELLDRCDQARFGGRAGAAAPELAAAALEALASLERAAPRPGPGRDGGGGARALLLVCAACGLALSAIPVRAAGDPAPLVARGNQAYTDGRFAEARDLYLEARALGLDAPSLHYNLGNAQARAGEIGPAVASYLRAQRQSPRDRDIRRNLSWMRQNLKDLELADQSLPLFIAQMAAVVGALSLDEWGIVLVVFLWLTAAIAGWGWARGATRRQRRLLVAAAFATAVAAVVTGGRWQQERVRDQAVVVAGAVEVRSGPAPTFPTLFEVHAGLALNVQEHRDGWERVSLGGDWQGWLPAEAVEHVRLDKRAPAVVP